MRLHAGMKCTNHGRDYRVHGHGFGFGLVPFVKLRHHVKLAFRGQLALAIGMISR